MKNAISATGKPQRRRKYKKPELTSFSLVADEVLGVGCKTLESGAAVTSTTCIGLGCAVNGS